MSWSGNTLVPVLETLAADSSTEFGVPGARIELLRRFDGPFSTVQRVRIHTPARTTHAFIKVMKPYGPGEAELARIDRMLKREYLATCALYERLQQDASIGALRPLGYLPAHHALATEEVPGRPLGEILANATRITDELLAIAARVGAWTRIYQGIGEPSPPIGLDELRSYADHRLAQLEGRVISTAHRQAVLARFDALAKQIGSSVRGVPIHADLGPMNIIVDDNGRVTVIDFTMAKTGTALHDLSHVYFHLELMASQRRARSAMFRTLQRAMIAGYDTNLSEDDPLFRVMLILHSVCHVAMLAQRRVPLVDVAYRWFLRRRWHICEQMPSARQELQIA